MSINNKTKAAVNTLLTDDATTEAQFKTGLQDVTTEVDNLNTGTVKTNTSFGGDVSGTYDAIVVTDDSHTHDTRYYTETEIDSMFSGTTDKTGYNNDNWDTAYGWGDHGAVGYLTDVNVSDIVADDLLISTETFVDSDTKVMTAAAVDDRITERLPSDSPPSDTEREQWDSAYDAVISGTADVNIEQGAIDGTPIGATTASTGAFTTLTTSGQATLDSLSVSNNVGISGNLTVSGTTTSLETTNTNITDRVITLNKGMTSSETNTQDMGFYFYRGDQSGPAFYFDESEDKFRFTYPTLTPSPAPGTSVNPTPLSFETAHTFYNTLGNYVDIQAGQIEGTSALITGISIENEMVNGSSWGSISRGALYGPGIQIKGRPLHFYGANVGGHFSISGEQNYYGWNWYNSYGSSVPHHETKFIYNASANDNTYPVQLSLQAKDDANNLYDVVGLWAQVIDATSTSKDTKLHIKTFTGNSQYSSLTLSRQNADFLGTVSTPGLTLTGGGTARTVDVIRDEDNMASNDANAIATQQSIKAYVDNEISNVGSGPAGSVSGSGTGSGSASSTVSIPANNGWIRHTYVTVNNNFISSGLAYGTGTSSTVSTSEGDNNDGTAIYQTVVYF